MAIPDGFVRRAEAICPVSRETLERLDGLVGEVERWSRSINLVSDARVTTIWERHVLDSLQLFPHRHPSGKLWCDLGTGGGFPGLVVAILARELAPDLSVTMVESDQRKAAFLAHAVRTLNLRGNVRGCRAEELPPVNADTVSARALAPLERLLPLVSRHLSPGGVALLPKGRNFTQEIAAARRHWAFAVEPIESILSAESRILRLTDLRSSDAG